MRRFLRNLVTAMVVLVVATVIGGFFVFRAAKHEPEFYAEALRVEVLDQQQAGDELEKNVLELHNEARHEGAWQAVFTADQLNGWLASELPEKMPSLLPDGVTDPRVAIDEEFIRVACRFDDGRFATVISFALDIDLTEDETNQLAVRIAKVRAGALPVPLKRFLDRISRAAQRGDIPLKWSQTEGDPVALVRVPVQHEDYAHREIYLETIELREGEVFLAGRTERAAQELIVRATESGSENETTQR